MNIGANEPIKSDDLANSSQLEQLRKELQMQRYILIGLALLILLKK